MYATIQFRESSSSWTTDPVAAVAPNNLTTRDAMATHQSLQNYQHYGQFQHQRVNAKSDLQTLGQARGCRGQPTTPLIHDGRFLCP